MIRRIPTRLLASTPPDPPAAPVNRLTWLLVATLCAVQFVDVLGTTVVIVALPAIQDDLRLSDAGREQVAAAYALLFGALLLLAGRLADVLGTRRMFIAGLVAFAAGSVIGGLAPDGATLIGGRAIQGLGAALGVPAALAMITTLLPRGPDRNRALGWWAATGAAGGAAGFALGGVITDTVGWRWTLLVNVPPIVVAILVVLAIRVVPPPRVPGRVPILASVALTAGLLALTFGLTNGQVQGFDLLSVLVPVAAGVVLLGAFAAGERRHDPLVPRATWQDRALVIGSGVGAALTFTTSAGAVLLTLWLQGGAGLSASAAGWALAPFSVAVIVGASLGARLVSRDGAQRPMVWGLLVVAMSQAIEVAGLGTGSVPLVIVGLAISGLGLGVASVASTSHGLSRTDASGQGAASGLLNATARVGTAVGIAIYGILVAAGRDLAPASIGGEAVVVGYPVAIGAGAVILVAAAAVVSGSARRTG